MALSSGNKITQADINTLITALNAENTRRGSPYTAITVPAQGAKMTATLGQAMEVMPRNLNTIHKITRTGKAAGTAGGTPTGFDNTDRSASYASGQKASGSLVAIINTNITKLAAQCNCNTFVATTCCNSQANCTANGNNCVNCCNANTACCNGQCVNNSYNCCNSNCCNSNCANCGNCTCNTVCCNAQCSCNTVCTCNLNCSCEFN